MPEDPPIRFFLSPSDVGPGDRVLCASTTFVATANPILYLGAEPVFVDTTERDRNLEVALVAEEQQRTATTTPNSTADTAASGDGPYAAVIAVDLYGRCADDERLERLQPSDEQPAGGGGAGTAAQPRRQDRPPTRHR